MKTKSAALLGSLAVVIALAVLTPKRLAAQAANAVSPLTITSGAPPSGVVGRVYDFHCLQIPPCNVFVAGYTVTAAGGLPPYSWSWAPQAGSALPPGLFFPASSPIEHCLNVDASSICGKPTTEGTYEVVITVKDSESPPRIASAAYTIHIFPAPASTWYVNGISGNNANDCKSPTSACKTIGHGISLAASGDTIMVAAATYHENLTVGVSLNVIGSGAATTIVDGGGIHTVVAIDSGAQVTLSKLTIRHGTSKYGGGIYNSGKLTINNSTLTENKSSNSCTNLCPSQGGGIFNNGGTLAINNSTLTENTASISCTGQCHSQGGGIFNSGGTLAINNSTLSTNIASASCPFRGAFCTGDGGGIFNYGGALMVSRSTINGNSANAGGGIDDNSGILTISNTTFYGNSANFNRGNAFGGGIVSSAATISNSTFSGNSAQGSLGSFGGAIEGNATLQNSIVANSPSGGDCSGTVKSNGYNLSSDGSCNFNHAGDLNNHDPLLGPLQHNGGPTETMALLPGSPAIDAGNPSGCTDGEGHLLRTDQRGMPRPDREDAVGCDMGAFERQSD